MSSIHPTTRISLVFSCFDVRYQNDETDYKSVQRSNERQHSRVVFFHLGASPFFFSSFLFAAHMRYFCCCCCCCTCTHKKNTGAPKTLELTNHKHTFWEGVGGFLFFDDVVVVVGIIWDQLHCNQVADSPTDGGAIRVLRVSDYGTKRVHHS